MTRNIKDVLRLFYPIAYPPFYVLHKALLTPINRLLNSRNPVRKLEIGPGPIRIAGFETLNIVAGLKIDYVYDANRKLPFPDGTFDLIYASHVLEHLPWYKAQETLNDWVRALKRGGQIELWVPNGLLIAKTFLNAEIGSRNDISNDGWYRFNSEHDPCLWANGRIFSYGGGDGRRNHPNWHLSLFSPRYLREIMERAGLAKVTQLDRKEVRGHDHGWINLGLRGTRP